MFNNIIIVCSHFIKFNGNVFNFDRGGSAYSVHFTSDGLHMLVCVKNPHSINIANLKTSQVHIIRGLEEIFQFKILAFSMRPQEKGQVSKTNFKKAYLIYTFRDQIFLKGIQFQPKIDYNPKQKTKRIEQKYNVGQNSLKVTPIFSNYLWNMFILCKKQMRTCSIVTKNDEIQFNFKIQMLQPTLRLIFTNYNLVGIAQSFQTWCVVASNNQTKQQNLSIYIFWQHHKNSKQISTNMYYMDKSFIKMLNIPCQTSQFVKLWQNNGYYLIESKNKSKRSHQCHMVSQLGNCSKVFSFNLHEDSQVCQNSLKLTQNSINICQIVNRTELYQVVLAEGQQNQPNFSQSKNQISASSNGNKIMMKTSSNDNISTNITTNIGNSYNNTNSNTNNDRMGKNQNNNETRPSARSVGQVKKFTPIEQNTNKTQNSGKNTVKKQQPKPSNKGESTKVEQTNFINPKLTQFLKQQQANNAEQTLQVPSTYQRLVSFGVGNNDNKKNQIVKNQVKPDNKQITKNEYMSFGAPSIKVIQQPEANKTGQLKTNNKLDTNTNVKPNTQSSTTNLAIRVQKPLQMSFGSAGLPVTQKTATTQSKPSTQQQKNKGNPSKFQISVDKCKEITQWMQKIVTNLSQQLSERQMSLRRNYQLMSSSSISEQLKIQGVFSQQECEKLVSYVNHANRIRVPNIEQQSSQQIMQKLKVKKKQIDRIVNKCELLSYYQAISLQSNKPTSKKNIQHKIRKSIKQQNSRLTHIQRQLDSFLDNHQSSVLNIRRSATKQEKFGAVKPTSTRYVMSLYGGSSSCGGEKQMFFRAPIYKFRWIDKMQPLLKFQPIDKQEEGPTREVDKLSNTPAKGRFTNPNYQRHKIKII